ETVAFEVLREIRRKRQDLPGYTVVVNCHPAVADMLTGSEKNALQDAESRYMRRIQVNARTEYHLEQFDLVGKRGDMTDAHNSPPAAPEKREGQRLTINKEFESFDAFIQEYVTNISRTGVFIKSQQPLPVGTRVNLRFTVIMEDIETIEGVGEVVRV